MTNQQGAPEALRLADEWQRKTQREADRQNSAYDHYGMGNTPETVDPLGAKMSAELRRLHAENERLAALVEAQQPAPSAAPAGWKLVPVEPTEEMLKGADDGDDAYTLRSFGPDVQRVMQGPYDHYCAMLEAAPTPPTSSADSRKGD